MRKKVLVTALGLAMCAGTAHAALEAVDPGPYTAATGFFPQWYRDTNTLSLDLCLSKALSSRVPGAPGAPSYMCTLLPNPGVFDDAQPIVFPSNFPDEAFWFTADANVVGQGIDLAYIAALEAAFGQGLPAPGDQVSFARIRVRADFDVTVPTPGTYAIIHPYGVEIFSVAAPGRRVINATRDIGIGAPGDFTGALLGDIGPFLQSVNGPYSEINPDTGATDTFVGDPNLLEQVTGSPFGTNFVQVQRINPAALPALQPVGDIDVSTNVFAISGRVFNNVPPTAVTVDRASYSRTVDPTTGAVTNVTIDGFATSSPTATVCFRETLELVGGTSPCQFGMTGDTTGKFFGRDPIAPGVPPFIVVTATDAAAGTSSTSIAQSLGDVVKAPRVQFGKDTRTLIIEATTSDEVTPKITAVGVGVLTPAGVGTRQCLKQVLPAEPPASVTLVSSGGGRHTEPVTVVASVAAGNNPPVANPNSATTPEGTPVVIAVLGNDTDVDCDALTVTAAGPAGNGTVTVNAGTTVTYAPNGDFFGTDSFEYTISDGSTTATALVTVTVTPVNDPPVVVNDAFTTAEDTALIITDAQLLVNDTDADGGPLSITAFNAQGLAGTLINRVPGVSVTFQPAANFVGNTSFSYTVSDGNGGTAVGTVTVTVTAVNDAPVAANDTATTAANTAVTINVLANDTDVDNAQNTLSVATATNGTNGTVTNNGGNVTYTPNAGFSGTDSFTYRAQDPSGAVSNEATVTVTVTAAPAVLVDLDIDRLTVPNSVRRPATVTPSLRVTNGGAVNQPRLARIVGRTAAQVANPNLTPFYDQTVAVSDAVGGGVTTFTFPTSQSTTVAGAGVITWTATIADDNPDDDTATATTTVR